MCKFKITSNIHFLATVHSMICGCIAEKKTDVKMPKNTKARGSKNSLRLVMRIFPFCSCVNQPAAKNCIITQAQIDITVH